MSATQNQGGLAGLVILEIADAPGACFAGSLLADMNATVLVCEKPGVGSAARGLGPKDWWTILARNKQSVAIEPVGEGADIARRLLARADAVITDIAPQDRATHPWLSLLAGMSNAPLVIDIFPTGADRPDLWPWSTRADMVAAPAGAMAVTGHENAEPIQAEFPLVEYLGATLAAMRGVAEIRRAKTGAGPARDVNVALHQAVVRMIEWQAQVATATGKAETRVGNAFPMNSGISNMHLTKDGKFMAISAANQASAVKLMNMVGGPELAADPRFATVEARAADIGPLYAIMDGWFLERTAQEVLDTAAKADVVVGPIFATDDILAHPHIAARANLVEFRGEDGKVLHMPGIVPRFSDIETSIRNLGPALGADNAALTTLI